LSVYRHVISNDKGTVMPTLDSLPPELILDILSFAIGLHPNPSSILATSRRLHALGTPLLYAAPSFRSARALAAFPLRPPVQPRALHVHLAGGEVGAGQFRALATLIRHCLRNGGRNDNVLQLEELSLCMNSTADPKSDDSALEALGLVEYASIILSSAVEYCIQLIDLRFCA